MSSSSDSHLPIIGSVDEGSNVVCQLLKDAGLPYQDLDLQECISVVLRIDDTIVGHAAVEPYGYNGVLRSVVVGQTQRGRGFGYLLVKHIETLAVERTIRLLFLLTETAENFFHSCGYRKVDRALAPTQIQESSQFSHVCPSTATLMMKELSPQVHGR